MPASAAPVDALRRTLLFSGYSDPDLEEVEHFSHPHFYAAGELLFREGEPCSAVYCVADGFVKLYVSGPRDHEKIVEFVEPGQTFAEAAMFSGQGYPVSAMAVEDTKVIAVEAYAFMRYLRAHPELSWKMLAVTSRRLHQLVGQVKSMCLHSAEQKVASYLMDNYDAETPAAPVGHLPPRRSELASALGIKAETLCRIISSFRKSGWIQTHDSAIVVRAPEALLGVMEQPAHTTCAPHRRAEPEEEPTLRRQKRAG